MRLITDIENDMSEILSKYEVDDSDLTSVSALLDELRERENLLIENKIVTLNDGKYDIEKIIPSEWKDKYFELKEKYTKRFLGVNEDNNADRENSEDISVIENEEEVKTNYDDLFIGEER